MIRKIVFVLSLSALLTSLFCVGLKPVEVKASEAIDTSKVYGVEMLWNNSMTINDVAVSKDGNYIAAVNNTGIYYFASDTPVPEWWYVSLGPIFSVAISASGEYVVAGNGTGHILFFNGSTTRTKQQLSPTWQSIDMGGPVERGTLDISGDGNYVVLGGTAVNVWYYSDCRNRSGSGQFYTWVDYLSEDVNAVDMSSDGKFVAAGGIRPPGDPGGFVAFYKDANNATIVSKLWHSRSSIGSGIVDLALSDDGYAVVAVSETTIKTLYYWANATTLSKDPNATWTNDGSLNCVDMSANGDKVIAGTAPLSPCGLHFWNGARGRSGPDQVENWTRIEGEIVFDVAMSDDGGVIAATTRVGITSDYKAYFFTSDGSMIDEFNLTHWAPFVSMSGDGRIVAMGDPGLLTLYVFEVLEDLTPPLIENVYQQPTNDTVEPEDKVMVYANISDDRTGVKQGVLSYTTDNETWFIVNMTNLEGNRYNATIPPFPYCTNVRYIIMAEDYANNTITTEEMGYTYQYHVIPEFPTSPLMLLMIIVLTVAIVIYKRRHAEFP